MNTNLLIVDGDRATALDLAAYLTKRGLPTSTCPEGNKGMQVILQSRPALVIIGKDLPDCDGVDLCRRLREQYLGAILMLTAEHDTAVEVCALEQGADDVVWRPVHPRALLARVHALLRRVGGDLTNEARRIGALEIDRSKRAVRLRGERVRLTTTELDVLWMLCKSPGEVVTRHALYRSILGIEYDGFDRGMDVHVSRIRSKLDKLGFAPLAIRAVRGEGYILSG